MDKLIAHYSLKKENPLPQLKKACKKVLYDNYELTTALCLLLYLMLIYNM